MKKFILIILIFTSSLVASAQSADENSVARAVEKLRSAMISGNKVELESILAKGLTYGHSSGKIQDKETFVTEISTKKSDFVSIQLSEQTISITGDVAIVRHILDARTNDGGKPAAPHLGIVLVWRKMKGEWKLIARRSFHVAP
jgi:ketosteroid isomerase-like protein